MAKFVVKICSRCKLELSASFFYPEKRQADGLRRYCKDCSNSACRKYRLQNKDKCLAYREKNKEARRESRLLKRYGIDTELYNTMLIEQDYKCKICKNKEIRTDYRTGEVSRLAVDHCHKTGKVRGLLCNKCNVMLGLVDDSISYLTDLILYVVDSNE